jgi:hypothetical protein
MPKKSSKSGSGVGFPMKPQQSAPLLDQSHKIKSGGKIKRKRK